MPDIAIVNQTVAAEPKDYTLTGSQELLLKSVRATIDGSGAGSAFQPTLQMLAPDGTVMWEAFNTTAVAAGASADVSWFPRVGVGNGSVVQRLVGARIEASSTQTVSNVTNTDLVYQTVDFDTNGMVNLGADARKLTVNTSGLYIVTCETIWAWTAASAGRRINVVTWNEFYSSGSFPANQQSSDSRMAIWQSDGTGGPTPYTTNTSVGLFDAAAGDFFASGCYQASGANATANGLTNCFLSAILLGT